MDNRNTFSNLTDPNYAEHYGTPHMGHVPHSGRYPWGSGDNPNQHDRKFLERVDSYKAQGMTQLQIAKSMNMTTTQLREEIGKRRAAVDAADLAKARKLMAQGMSRNQAAKIIGRNESTLRSMEKTEKNSRSVTTQQNVDELKKLVEKYKYVDVGKGSENGIGATGITSYKLNSALQALKAEGYVIEGPYYTQMTTGKRTNQKILCPPGTTWAEVQNNQDKIVTPGHVMFYDSREKELHLLERPVNIDSKRVQVRYAEDGGSDKDGLIELRRGCEDLDLCRARYAQVRIAVDGTHYLKGVAVYGRDKDFEPGKDIIYNSSKKRGTPLMSDDPDAKQVFKPMEKGNPQNPFGAEIKPESRLKMVQKRYTGSDGKEHLSALNIVNEEGDWMEWHKSLASQFLSKQPPALAKQQLGLARKALEEEYEEICMFTNPTVRAKLKAEFADKCDEQATELRGMPLPRQTTCAILPMPTLKPNECYDPAHRDGEEVIMVRYPCAGIFEIPRLTVNNRNREGRELIGINPKDAVGIHPKTAQQLSGADFDGDNVLVIPTKGLNIRTHGPLSQLKDFDPREEFPNRPGIKPMTKHQRGIEMGKATNLITDMTIKGGFTEDELARAVRHSMVCVDAYKHKLDFRKSFEDNQIAELKLKYQGKKNAGASTLISRATAEDTIPDREEKRVSFMTPAEKKLYDQGYKIYRNTGYTKMVKKEGSDEWERVPVTTKVSRMSKVKDAYELASGGSRETTTRIERVYADHANALKALALEARKSAREEKDIEYDPSARKTFDKEVRQLKSELNRVEKNQPLERLAQRIANKSYKVKMAAAEKVLDAEHRSRLKSQELFRARELVGASRQVIDVTERQWAAIMAGAVSKTLLKRVLAAMEPEQVRMYATPRAFKGLSPARVSRARAMLANGATQADVADALNVSVSTLIRALDEA